MRDTCGVLIAGPGVAGGDRRATGENRGSSGRLISARLPSDERKPGRRRIRPAFRRERGRHGRVQERPTAYAESPRPLRREGPAGHVRSLISGDQNVALAIVRCRAGARSKVTRAQRHTPTLATGRSQQRTQSEKSACSTHERGEPANGRRACSRPHPRQTTYSGRGSPALPAAPRAFANRRRIVRWSRRAAGKGSPRRHSSPVTACLRCAPVGRPAWPSDRGGRAGSRRERTLSARRGRVALTEGDRRRWSSGQHRPRPRPRR